MLLNSLILTSFAAHKPKGAVFAFFLFLFKRNFFSSGISHEAKASGKGHQ
jgi:hypothetical protein